MTDLTDVTDQSAETTRVELTAPGGGRYSFTAEAGADRPMDGGALVERELRVIGDPPPELCGARVLAQRRAANTARPGDWSAVDALDAEIRIGVHLLRGCERVGLEYPPELSRLVGYDVTAEEPFALFLPWRGEPSAAFAGRLVSSQEIPLRTGLFRALRLLDGLGVVHRGISSRTVRWDTASRTVQLVDFSAGLLVGERPPDGKRSPSQPPAREGAPVSTSEDVYSAGALLCHLVTGREFTGPDSVSRRDLQELLQGVFAPAPDARPAAAALLERVHAPDPWPRVPAGPDPALKDFEEGRRAFDAELARKARASAPPVADPLPAQAKPASGGPGAANRWIWPLALGAAMTVALVALVVLR